MSLCVPLEQGVSISCDSHCVHESELHLEEQEYPALPHLPEHVADPHLPEQVNVSLQTK